MTAKLLFRIIVVTGLLGAYSTANAVSITAVADSNMVLPGGQLTVLIIGNFDDDPTIGGSFDVLFNPADLAVADYAPEMVAADTTFNFAGTVTDGNIIGQGFGDFSFGCPGNNCVPAGGDFLLATIVFDVVGAFTTTDITMQDGTGGAGGFFSAATFQAQVVDYRFVVIPVPAAVWLMIGGLGALIGFGWMRA